MKASRSGGQATKGSGGKESEKKRRGRRSGYKDLARRFFAGFWFWRGFGRGLGEFGEGAGFPRVALVEVGDEFVGVGDEADRFVGDFVGGPLVSLPANSVDETVGWIFQHETGVGSRDVIHN